MINLNINSNNNIDNSNINTLNNPIPTENNLHGNSKKSSENVTKINGQETSRNSSSNKMNFFYKKASMIGNNISSVNNSSINNTEDIAQKLKDTSFRRSEKSERNIGVNKNLSHSSKKNNDLGKDTKIVENLLSTIGNIENHNIEAQELRNISINDKRNTKINIYNNYGILPNNLKIIRNKLHNSSPSNFENMKENSKYYSNK
jgi:hypothetical protein